MTRDGGTVFFTLVHSEGHREPLCFDYQIQTKTPGRLYIGGGHRTKPGAKLVPLGSDLERKILRILQRHVDRQFTRSEQAELVRLEPQEALKRHGEKGADAYRLLTSMTRLKALASAQRREARP